MDKFEDWVEGFERMLEMEEKNFKEHNIGLSTSELHKKLLPQYIAYRDELVNRKLVFATWSLSIATIIFTAISLFLKIG